MEEIILKKLLSPLTRIYPDSAYMKHSKELIAFSRQEVALKPLRVRLTSRIFESVTFTASVALASVLLVIGLGSLSSLGGANGQVAASFNNDSLALEAKSADFNIQIQAITYFDESAKQVSLALDKISEITNNNGETTNP